LRLKLGDCGRDGHGRSKSRLVGVSNFHLPRQRRQMNKKAVVHSWRRRLLEDVEGV
jgi:hypothetical protein